MLSLVAALAVLQMSDFAQFELPNPSGGASRLMYVIPSEPLATAKKSPKKFGDNAVPFEFDWLVAGYARLIPNGKDSVRFRVYSQEHKQEGDLAPQVAQTLLRLFDQNHWGFGFDHNEAVNNGIVDVYLCYGGIAGGEQLLGTDVVNNQIIRVNTIYIYDLPSFSGSIERLREVAHEYGHASLPAVGGFVKPEDWANGYLGEKVYLSRLRNLLAAGKIDTRDTMGATLADLDQWVKTNVEPLVKHAAESGPEPSALNGTGPAAMDAYLGLATYMATILPDAVFGRSMKLAGSVKAPDYLTGISLAVQERSSRLAFPSYLKGVKVWVPVSDGTLSGTPILKRKPGWAQILVDGAIITVVPKRID